MEDKADDSLYRRLIDELKNEDIHESWSFCEVSIAATTSFHFQLSLNFLKKLSTCTKLSTIALALGGKRTRTALTPVSCKDHWYTHVFDKVLLASLNSSE